MIRKGNIYDVVFKAYNIQEKALNKATKNTIQSYIRRHLKKEYGNNVKWENLSQLEKDRFVYIIIYNSMFQLYSCFMTSPQNAKKYIQKKINETLIGASENIKKYNDDLAIIYKHYYNEADSEEDKKKAYTEFAQNMNNLFGEGFAPLYEKWIEQNKGREPDEHGNETTLRIIDYVKSYQSGDYLPDNSSVSPSEIDHFVIEIICHYLSKNIDINLPLIRESLEFIKNHPREDSEPFLLEYDPDLPQSKEEQNKIIENNKMYMYYRNMLEDKSNFYKKKE